MAFPHDWRDGANRRSIRRLEPPKCNEAPTLVLAPAGRGRRHEFGGNAPFRSSASRTVNGSANGYSISDLQRQSARSAPSLAVNIGSHGVKDNTKVQTRTCACRVQFFGAAFMT